MYGIDPTFDVSPFVGCSIAAVEFLPGTIAISVAPGRAVVTAARIIHLVGARQILVDPSDEASLLNNSLDLALGQRIVQVVAAHPKSLQFVLADGQALCFLDDFLEYESFHVFLDGREMVV